MMNSAIHNINHRAALQKGNAVRCSGDVRICVVMENKH